MWKEQVNLNGEYKGLGLWLSSFKNKEGEEVKSIGGRIVVDGNIPDGEYFVNIYKNKDKKSEKSPDYTMYFVPAEETGKTEAKDVSEVDDF